ncbi:MAG TPA: hypothetical protein VNL37_05970, partial [Candidatus Polarisedimenticolia bacterium]|nr:hypothetical protein [Candidatus Polarisedimenticolia bacterium]
MTRRRLDRRRLPLIAGIWTAVVLLFAAQWYAYDAARGLADPFRYYLWWSAYSWGVLTPLVVLIAYRHPINARTWRRTIPLHLGASLLLVTFEISVEALIGLLRGHGGGSVSGTLVHY